MRSTVGGTHFVHHMRCIVSTADLKSSTSFTLPDHGKQKKKAKFLELVDPPLSVAGASHLPQCNPRLGEVRTTPSRGRCLGETTVSELRERQPLQLPPRPRSTDYSKLPRLDRAKISKGWKHHFHMNIFA